MTNQAKERSAFCTIDILYNKFLDTALPYISMAKSDANRSTFHKPLNIDMMWQNKKK